MYLRRRSVLTFFRRQRDRESLLSSGAVLKVWACMLEVNAPVGPVAFRFSIVRCIAERKVTAVTRPAWRGRLLSTTWMDRGYEAPP